MGLLKPSLKSGLFTRVVMRTGPQAPFGWEHAVTTARAQGIILEDVYKYF
jgi:hypothetical protein